MNKVLFLDLRKLSSQFQRLLDMRCMLQRKVSFILVDYLKRFVYTSVLRQGSLILSLYFF